ncbi:glycosyltransferase family 4 protein [Rhodococcoides yunnanense]|uniref:glycosyltransferase family 4 protein n=1 Tax=Rhodococcoides yunnanense TaxID=278209 RepID=UPI0009336E41|nr:glycosyltransferase family 4 protein [Rhodococcus yunnanensis]
MRVAIVSPGFPPDRGGVEAHVEALAEGLTAAGVDVEVFCAHRGARSTHVAGTGSVVVHTFPAWRVSSMSISPRLLWRALRLGPGFDVIHVHSYHATSGAAALVGLRARVVFTPHYHGVGHSRAAELLHRVYGRFGSVLFRLSRAVICVSEVEQELIVHDFPRCADRITVIPNGTNVIGIGAAAPFPNEPPTVLSVGRLAAYKHTERLVAAMADVSEHAQLVVIGDGPERAALEARVRDSGMEGRIRFTGQVDDVTLRRWLRTAAVLVSLSEQEAFGMAPVEAASAGARVVLSDIPAHRELERLYLGDAARIVAGHLDVASTIGELLMLKDRVVVEVPDWPSVAASTMSVYRSVCKR